MAEKLDRVLVNIEWVSLCPNATTEFFNPLVSDHSSFVLSLFEGMGTCPIPFKFFNAWTQDEEFIEIVKKAWALPVCGILCFKLFAG